MHQPLKPGDYVYSINADPPERLRLLNIVSTGVAGPQWLVEKSVDGHLTTFPAAEQALLPWPPESP